ncbi:MFS transporter [Sphingomonas sp. MMS24-J13]|uniref:MFS transporter n=1 Tax=Sphingomonas sp. MMS24-J13 TaxID=3238686 RepID=UPI00384F3442
MTNPDQADRRRRRGTIKAAVIGSAGNLVEWYDWFAYSAFSLYFAKRFFPEGDATAQLLQSAAIFALGFVMRPLGAWVLGRYADRYGRRRALVLSVAGMCGGSFLIAILPDASRIGVAAPALLLLARLVQGFALGGEYGASAAYMSEMAAKRWRGFWSSFHITSVMAGQLAAMAVLGVLQALLDDRAIEQWGWRVPFAIGGCLALTAAWMRGHAAEPARSERPSEPTIALLRRHRRSTLTVFALTSAGALAFYAYTTYLQKYLVNTAGFPRATATTLVSIALVFFMVIQPPLGALSDKIGRKPMLAFCFGVGMIATWPLLTMIGHARTPAAALVPMLVLIVILSGYTSVNSLFKAELFPASIRVLGIGLPYALANIAFGGTAEYVALWLKQAGHETGFFVYVSLVMAVALVVTLVCPDPARVSQIDGPR